MIWYTNAVTFHVEIFEMPPLRGTRSGYPLGFCGRVPVGTCDSRGKTRYVAWIAGTPVELEMPPKRKDVRIMLCRGSALAGGWLGGGTRSPGGAIVWRPDADGVLRPQELPSSDWLRAQAMAVAGDVVVGYGERKGGPKRGLVWNGTTEPVELPGPEDASVSATDGDTHVGYVVDGMNMRALLWHDGACVWLNRGNLSAEVLGVSGREQCGAVTEGGLVLRPVVWRGSAESREELLPRGVEAGRAMACAGEVQVGVVIERVFRGTIEPVQVENLERAAMWRGTPESFVDLHAELPKDIVTSVAHEVRLSDGKVCVLGWGHRRGAGDDVRGKPVAIVWQS